MRNVWSCEGRAEGGRTRLVGFARDTVESFKGETSLQMTLMVRD